MKRSPARKRNLGFTLYLSADEEALLAAHAARLGQTKAGVIRLLLRGALSLPEHVPEHVAAPSREVAA